MDDLPYRQDIIRLIQIEVLVRSDQLLVSEVIVLDKLLLRQPSNRQAMKPLLKPLGDVARERLVGLAQPALYGQFPPTGRFEMGVGGDFRAFDLGEFGCQQAPPNTILALKAFPHFLLFPQGGSPNPLSALCLLSPGFLIFLLLLRLIRLQHLYLLLQSFLRLPGNLILSDLLP